MVKSDSFIPGSDCIVVFADVLGSSETLKNGSDKDIWEYVRGIEGLYAHVLDMAPRERSKMFTDNFLLFTNDLSSEALKDLYGSIGDLQFDMICNYGLFLRGGLVIGRIDHIPTESDDFVVGRAIVDAYDMESNVAVYPRIVISNEIMKRYGSVIGLSDFVKSWDQPFIDYLRIAKERWSDNHALTMFRESLLRHISDNKRIFKGAGSAWDRVKDKDLWTLLYFNDFCETEGNNSSIGFVERLSERKDKIIIDPIRVDKEKMP